MGIWVYYQERFKQEKIFSDRKYEHPFKTEIKRLYKKLKRESKAMGIPFC